MKPVVDLKPDGAPPAMSWTRRVLCGVVGAALGLLGVYCITAPGLSGLAWVMGATLIFGAAVLIGSALFPSLTFQKIDRNRWR